MSKSREKSWAKALMGKDFVVLDVETTCIKGEIIQLAVCDSDGNALINTLIKPVKYPISQWVQDNIKITPEMVEDAPTFADVYNTLIDVIKDKIVVIYNSSFDTQRLKVSAKVNDLPSLNNEAERFMCAMKHYAQYNPDKMSPYGKSGGWWKLEEAIAEENIETDNANFHDAMFDVRATLAVLQSMAGVDITAFDVENDPIEFISDDLALDGHQCRLCHHIMTENDEHTKDYSLCSDCEEGIE